MMKLNQVDEVLLRLTRGVTYSLHCQYCHKQTVHVLVVTTRKVACIQCQKQAMGSKRRAR